MPSEQFIRTASLLFALLNPFLISIYLMDLIQELEWTTFSAVLVRGSLISGAAFVTFALLGEAVFTGFLQVRFSSFLVFGGAVFLIVSLRSFFLGARALRELRGKPEHIAGSIAMPFMIGPATINASILAGHRLPTDQAVAAIVIPLIVSVLLVISLKRLYDLIQSRHESLVTRYIDVAGRATALVMGTIAVEMLFVGIETWMGQSL